MSSAPRNGIYSCCTARLAAAADMLPGEVLRALASLAAEKTVGFSLSSEEGPAFRVPRRPSAAALDRLALDVADWLARCLSHQVHQLDRVYDAFHATARASDADVAEQRLRDKVAGYMESPRPVAHGAQGADGDGVLPLQSPTPALATVIRAVLRQLNGQAGPKGACVGPLAITRMLHGLGSPAFPADTWRRQMGPFWASQTQLDFGRVWAAVKTICTASAVDQELQVAGQS